MQSFYQNFSQQQLMNQFSEEEEKAKQPQDKAAKKNIQSNGNHVKKKAPPGLRNEKKSKLHSESFDPLCTNINFNRTYVRQKPQMPQSPSIITNTDNSANKRSPFVMLDEDQEATIIDRSPEIQINKKIKEAINKTTQGSPLNTNLGKKGPVASVNDLKKELKSLEEKKKKDSLRVDKKMF